MAEQQPNINLTELNRTLSQSVIHYDFTRIDYTINDTELLQLEELGKDLWKDIFFATSGIALPTLINGIVAQWKLLKQAPWTTEIFLNYLIGGICLTLAIISLIIWRQNSKKKSNIVTKIKSKPPFVLPQAH